MSDDGKPQILIRLTNNRGIHLSEGEAKEAASRMHRSSIPGVSLSEPFYSDRDGGWYVELLVEEGVEYLSGAVADD